MRPTRFRAGAAEPFATERLHADDGADHVAVDVDVADVRGSGQRLRAGVDAGLDAEREPIAEGVDLRNHGFRRGERAAAPAHDLQHRAEDFVLHVRQAGDFEGCGSHEVGQVIRY